MTGREVALRLASALIKGACRRLPDGARDDRRREWEAELTAILDDPAVRSPLLRHARAVRFAAGQRRMVRRLMRPTGAARLRAVAIRAAVAAAAAAVLLYAAGLVLLPAANHAEYDDSPMVAVVVLLVFLAGIAGLACMALVAGLGLASVIGWLRNRQRRGASTGGHSIRGGRGGARHRLAQTTGLAWRKARTARGAGTVLVAAVSFSAAVGVATYLLPAMSGPSPAWFLVRFLAFAAVATGLACLTFLAGLAAARTAIRLWRLAHHTPRPAPSQGNPAGRQPAEPADHPAPRP